MESDQSPNEASAVLPSAGEDSAHAADVPDAEMAPISPNLASTRLKQLSSRLVQVDRRNPTIRLLKLAKERAFDVTSLERFRAGTSSKLLSQILADKTSTLLNFKDRPAGAEKPLKSEEEGKKGKQSRDDYRAAQAWRKAVAHLTTLRRKKNSNYEESGSQDFYLGFPWISGCCEDEDGTFLQAPLLLLPVDIEIDRSKGMKWKLSPAQDQYPIFNSTLVQALERYHGATLPQEFIEEAEAFADDKSRAKTPELILEWFGEHLAKYGVKVSQISYPLRPLPLYRSEELPTSTRGFALSSHVVFGTFPLSNSALKQDYEAMQEMARDSAETLPTVLPQLLSAEATEDAPLLEEEGELSMDSTPEAETCFVIQSDASQEEVLLQARREHCLVVHGPPGTGKSQVIVNLISDALSRKERVLVCCQKRAALDVVYQRLDKHGLSRHCALVHDASADRKELYASISRAMDAESEPSRRSADLEDSIRHLAEKIDTKTATLKSMAHELHRLRRFGMRARDLYAECAGHAPPMLDVKSLATQIDKHQLDAFHERLQSLAQVHQHVAPNHPWQGRKSLAGRSKFDADKAQQALGVPAKSAATLSTAFEALSNDLLTPRLLGQHEEALEGIQQRADALRGEGARAIHDFLESGSPTSEQLSKTLSVLREHLPALSKLPARPKASLSDDPGAMAYQLETYLEHYKGFFKFLNGGFRDAKKAVEPYLGKQGIAKDDESLRKAIADLRSQQRWANFDLDVKDLSFNEGLSELRESGQLDDLIRAFEGGLAAFAAEEALRTHHRALVDAFETSGGLDAAAEKLPLLRQAIAACGEWRASLSSLEAWLEASALDQLSNVGLEGKDSAQEAINALSAGLADFDDLVTLDSELAKCSEAEREVYRELLASEIALGQWAPALRLAVLFAWIEDAEGENPILREASSPSFAKTSHSFFHDIRERRELNRLRLEHDLFNDATNIRFEPGRVTDKRHSAEKPFNDLRHQVNKKSRLWSLRRLVSTLWWPLREVMPVWLVSPETLSAAFPLERDLFDLVIFDEASQCAVEQGIPATYRGKRVVIAGDEQQLQPSAMFKTKSEFHEDESADADAEPQDSEAIETDSILRLARARFPQRMLTWHYRSQFEELIDFSNHGFYDGRLKTVPDTLAGAVVSPIEYLKVADGAWRNRANRPEAERVVEEVYQLLLKHGEAKSLGVITFNVTQREMILNVIDERANQDAEFAEVFAKARGRANLDDALFVKNIENVQGDERDIIIFSIGYGPGEDGRVRASFGSLSQAGGENRLNVAVSRAREAIKVVASIEPEDLNVANATNRGPRLIRDYLAYARAVSRASEEARQAILKEINPAMDVVESQTQWFESPFEEQVHQALTKAGLKVDTQVGVSGYRLDLAIVDPNLDSQYVIGIECDGATYHSAPSVRERDAYRQKFLESRGWAIYRIWSRNWWNNPQREIDAILALVKEHQSPAPPPETESGKANEGAKEDVSEAEIDGKPKGRPGGYQGEFPPEGEIRAWLEETRDGFTYCAIADFGEEGRMDEYGWAVSRIEARAACEKAQLHWLSDHSMPANLYITPEGSKEPEEPEAPAKDVNES